VDDPPAGQLPDVVRREGESGVKRTFGQALWTRCFTGLAELVPESRLSVTALTVEQGSQLVLTGGASFPDQRFAETDPR
jgi:hypothetical protein